VGPTVPAAHWGLRSQPGSWPEPLPGSAQGSLNPSAPASKGSRPSNARQRAAAGGGGVVGGGGHGHSAALHCGCHGCSPQTG
jgi:hypothetical protein